ncbi:MAG: SRPBCC domain-containing protein [Cyanobacteria bacterium P01_A01_bin.17]
MTNLIPATASLQQRLALMKGWTTDVVIQAPQQQVWEQVTDFAHYADWNPFVREAHAQFEVGKTIRFLEDLKQFGQHWITAQFLAIEPPHSFIWKGHFGAPFLFSVRHSFKLEAISEEQTRFSQVHENAGILPPFLAWRGIYTVSYQRYLDYDQALKARCEQL